ncbi:uncharacterized protein LOC134476372 [Cavia porcellus]|uniref:uncharacterized protein LOC134476372 n=1 Tax=Cavia porcellus TaxID=10141 RepID=UPI002FE39AB4
MPPSPRRLANSPSGSALKRGEKWLHAHLPAASLSSSSPGAPSPAGRARCCRHPRSRLLRVGSAAPAGSSPAGRQPLHHSPTSAPAGPRSRPLPPPRAKRQPASPAGRGPRRSPQGDSPGFKKK